MGVWFPALAAISGWYLLGVSVTVAAVVYPSFALVGPEQWPAFHTAHSRAIVAAVGPGWVVEGVATVGWLVQSVIAPAVDGRTGLMLVLVLAHAVAAGATVVLTVAAAVPVHSAFARSRAAAEPGPLRRLRVTHGQRTAAWAIAAVSATAALALHR